MQRKRVFLLVLVLLSINIAYGEINVGINAQLGGYNTDYYLLSKPQASRTVDNYDMIKPSLPSNYSALYSEIGSDQLVIDAWNISDLPRTINLKYETSQAMSGILSFLWSYSSTEVDLDLVDYGTDSSRTTALQTVDMRSQSSYSKDLTGTEAEKTIYLQILVSEYTAESSSPSSPSTTTGGGSTGGGSILRQNVVALQIIPTSNLKMYSEDQLTSKVKVINIGEVDFDEINIDINPLTEDLSAEPQRVTLQDLKVNSSATFDVDIQSHTDPGVYEIDLVASSDNPRYRSTTKMIINLVDRATEGIGDTSEKLDFAYELFRKNPECTEFIDVLRQAEEALENEEYEKASALTESAINACKETLAAMNRPSLMRRAPDRINILLTVMIVIVATLVLWIMMERLKVRHKEKRIVEEKVKEKKPKQDIWKR